MTQYRIIIDSSDDIEKMAVAIMLGASGVFGKCFPNDWKAAMTALVEKINRQVREQQESGMPLGGLLIR